MNAFVVTGVPLDRDVEHLALFFVLVVSDLVEQRFLRLVEMLHVVDNAALVLEGDFLFLAGSFVAEDDLESAVQEGHRLQTLEHGTRHELGAFGGEDRGVGPEHDGGAGLASATGRGAGRAEFALRLAAVAELLLVSLAIAVDLEGHALRQRVHHRHTHTVQTTRHLVALATELAAGVQNGEHDFGRALALVWARRIRIDRNATPVVLHSATAVGKERHADTRAVTRHRLVDRVVDDLPDEVVKTGQTRGPDVHAGPLAYGVEAFQDLDVLGAVIGTGGGVFGGHAYLDRFTRKGLGHVGEGGLPQVIRGSFTTPKILLHRGL